MMSREIRFRGKRVDNGEWVYGSLVIENEKRFIIDKTAIAYKQGTNGVNTIYREKDIHQVFLETARQYTGMEDRNGKDIYEGDIVYSEHYGQTEEIKWYTSGYWINNGDQGFHLPSILEVVGNVHDTPEPPK